MDNPEDLQHSPENLAYVAAIAGQEFIGTVLQPWTPDRKMAAQCMGMRYPFIGEDAAAQLAETGIYAGALKDTVIYLWLCTREQTSDILRAIRKPSEAIEHAQHYAEKSGLLDLQGEPFGQAYSLFIEKMLAEQTAHTKPVPMESEGSRPKAEPSPKAPTKSKPRNGPKV